MSINPVSTYRIQLNKDFQFPDLEQIIPYLHELGVKTIYASPVFEATPGSTHGYDGTDPNSINPEIGTEEQLIRISDLLREREMYWLQDIVPNHLSFHENNKWLMDVLSNGEHSAFASYFDIIWDHPEFNKKLMVPFPGSELEELLKNKFPRAEHYVVTSWQDTDHTINYRRFFLVNGLICTNVHLDHVFDAYHQLIKRFTDEKVFNGLRVDHVDGLYDPKKYLEDLRTLAGNETYIIVEKILEPGENMPDNWPIQGNSGYDFLGMVNNLFTNKSAEYELAALYLDIAGHQLPVEQQVHEKKASILHQHMRGELNNLTRLYRECGLASDLADEEIRALIAKYLVECPVYRYYDDIPVMDRDKGKAGENLRKFYTRCMQFTGPLMAKGVEDTLMYTYNCFIGHNEVGDSPEFFGYAVGDFHEMMIYRQRHWPLSVNGTSTHDTKRGEDVRARLNAVTCFYDEWVGLVRRWMLENADLKDDGMPEKNDEYFIYQTLIGSYLEESNYPGRLKEYFQKSLREAKTHSNWAEPNVKYENACVEFAKKLLEPSSSFMKSFIPFHQKIARYGHYNSVGQLVLKFTCPGVPDIYQGTELLDLSLVDPDNRRPVDYSLRQRLLQKEIDIFDNSDESGETKMSVLRKMLQIRNEFAELFEKGEYIPLNLDGKYDGHVIAFMRKHGRSAIIVTVPVHYALVANDGARFEDVLQGSIPENISKRQLFHLADLFQIIHLDLVG